MLGMVWKLRNVRKGLRHSPWIGKTLHEGCTKKKVAKRYVIYERPPESGGRKYLIKLLPPGTTWMQELVWLLTHKLDFEGAKTLLKYRSPGIE